MPCCYMLHTLSSLRQLSCLLFCYSSRPKNAPILVPTPRPTIWMSSSEDQFCIHVQIPMLQALHCTAQSNISITVSLPSALAHHAHSMAPTFHLPFSHIYVWPPQYRNALPHALLLPYVSPPPSPRPPSRIGSLRSPNLLHRPLRPPSLKLHPGEARAAPPNCISQSQKQPTPSGLPPT